MQIKSTERTGASMTKGCAAAGVETTEYCSPRILQSPFWLKAENGIVHEEKKLLFHNKARAEILDGVNALVNAVKVALGPRVRNIVIERPFGPPQAANAGVEASVVVDRVAQGAGSFGYNAATGVFGVLLKRGVIDPTKVTRTALQNAASVAGLILTTDCMIADAPKSCQGKTRLEAEMSA